jgi:metal-responsive CopG/Arc/MetJ family transcriptional regulator
MTRTAKIAVSVDKELLRRLEAIQLQTGETRSAAVSRALRMMTREAELTRQIEEYRRAYSEHPETAAEVAAARATARRALAALPWDDA